MGRDEAQLPRWRRGTRSRRVLEEMKKAMWRVDRTGGFRFSDKENLERQKLLEVVNPRPERRKGALSNEEMLVRFAPSPREISASSGVSS